MFGPRKQAQSKTGKDMISLYKALPIAPQEKLLLKSYWLACKLKAFTEAHSSYELSLSYFNT